MMKLKRFFLLLKLLGTFLCEGSMAAKPVYNRLQGNKEAV